jgi:hypothetical protein
MLSGLMSEKDYSEDDDYFDDRAEDEVYFDDSSKLVIEGDKFCSIGPALRGWTRKLRLLREDRLLINAKEIHAILHRALKTQGFVGIPTANSMKLFEITYESVAIMLDKKVAEDFRSVYEHQGDEFLLIRGQHQPKTIRRAKQTKEK